LNIPESVWCRIPLSGNDCLILGVIYHSPNSDSLKFDQLCSLLTQAVNIGASHLLIVGDFNMPYINLTSLTVSPANNCNEDFSNFKTYMPHPACYLSNALLV